MDLRVDSSVAMPDLNWGLVLARVFLQDSNLELSSGATLFDIPWYAATNSTQDACHIPSFSIEQRLDLEHCLFTDEYRKWSRFVKLSEIEGAFRRDLLANANYPIGGKPLRSYFTSTDEHCSESKKFMEIGQELFGGLLGSRLCTTESGLLGRAPKWAQIGDKIAVFRDCDMPLVVRPHQSYYELLGSCFIEGADERRSCRWDRPWKI
jgi:hypothetical protein